jgi:hypothetical protein
VHLVFRVRYNIYTSSSSLAINFLLGVDRNTVRFVHSQYHISHDVEINEYGSTLIQCYPPIFAYSVMLTRRRVDGFVGIVLRPSRDDFVNMEVRF